MQLEEVLERSALRLPQKVALISEGKRFTYAELDRLSNRLAHRLMTEGVRRGDRVAIFLENSAEAVISTFAVLKLGGVFLVINPSVKTDKLAYILNNCRAVAIISHAKMEPVVSAVEGQVNSLSFTVMIGPEISEAPNPRVKRLDWGKILTSSSGSADPRPIKSAIDIDLATIIYTSGSTGFPKGVMMTHLNMITAATSITEYLENTADDIILSVLPLSFDYGLYQILMAFKVGATVVLEKSFAYPAAILEKLSDEEATGFPIVPTMVAILLQMKGLTPGRFPKLRYMTNTAAALPPAHIKRLRELFPTTRIYSMYGLTECKRVAYLHPDQLDSRPTSVGKAIPNTEVYIVNDQGERVPPGEIGELVIRGAHVMKGYWERPEETDRALRPGLLPGEKVLYSGDLFKEDEEGYLYFVGRKDDIIKTRGEKVSPKEIEGVIYSLPQVAEVAVIGIEDLVLGQAIKAVIVLTKGAVMTEQDILRHCRANLEDFMIPKFIEFREALLPKTGTGKISKRELSIPKGKGE